MTDAFTAVLAMVGEVNKSTEILHFLYFFTELFQELIRIKNGVVIGIDVISPPEK